jgi:hypothetical protein
MDDDPIPPAPPEQLKELDRLVDSWLGVQLAENPVVVQVDRDPHPTDRRWLVRVTGDEKATFSIWFHLQQRTLQLETYVAPAPVEREADYYDYFLRHNFKLNGVSFGIGPEDAVYLRAHLPVGWVNDAELDRLFGTIYAATEMCFRPAMRIGYGDRFKG